MSNIKIIGDSILKGTLYNEETGSYNFNNYLCGIPDSENLSKFGLTVTKGSDFIMKTLEKDSSCSYVLMDFGGNDSDYHWEEISAHPEEDHQSKTPPDLFAQRYAKLIDYIRNKGITPVLTTLCPIDGQSYFNYFCSKLNCIKDNVLKWLRYIGRIEETQNNYSEAVKELACKKNIPLIDIRGAMLSACGGDKTALLCRDGIHANSCGQNIILSCIKDFFMIH